MMSLIQLLVRFKFCREAFPSKPSMRRMKLWFKSSLLRALESVGRPSIYSISLKDKIRVFKLTSLSKNLIFLMRFENRFRYTI